jgi:hypothetical protein
LEKDKDIDFDLLQDLMDVDIDPLDIDLEKDPLAAKVFKVSGTPPNPPYVSFTCSALSIVTFHLFCLERSIDVL